MKQWIFKQLNRSKWAVRIYVIVVGVPFCFLVVVPILVAVQLWAAAKETAGDMMSMVKTLAIRLKMGRVGSSLGDFL